MNENNKKSYTIECPPIPSCIKLPDGVKSMWIDSKDPSFPKFVQALVKRLPTEQDDISYYEFQSSELKADGATEHTWIKVDPIELTRRSGFNEKHFRNVDFGFFKYVFYVPSADCLRPGAELEITETHSFADGRELMKTLAYDIKPVGIPEVSELPNPTDYKGSPIVYLTADNKLYSYVKGAWELTIKKQETITASNIAAGAITAGNVCANDKQQANREAYGTFHCEGMSLRTAKGDTWSPAGFVEQDAAGSFFVTLGNQFINDKSRPRYEVYKATSAFVAYYTAQGRKRIAIDPSRVVLHNGETLTLKIDLPEDAISLTEFGNLCK